MLSPIPYSLIKYYINQILFELVTKSIFNSGTNPFKSKMFPGTRSACINAATLALADAGIPMHDLVTSCSAGYLNSTPLLGNAINFLSNILLI